MRKIVLCGLGALAALAALGAASCDYDLYVIEMTPRGDRIDRKLTVSREGPIATTAPGAAVTQPAEPRSVEPEKLAAIAKLYPGRPVRTEKGDVFSGTFAQRLPQDVGGRGYYLNQDTTLGSVRVYVEDFRGNDEPAAVMEKAFKAADTLVDLLAGYLKTQAGGEGEFDKLDRFLRGPFRQDVKNLYMYVWLGTQEDRDHAGETGTAAYQSPAHRYVARACVYLLSRGYIEASDAEALARLAVVPGGPEKEAGVKRLAGVLVRRALAGKASVKSQALAEKIESLLFAEASQEAFREYAASRGYPTSRPASGPASRPATLPAEEAAGELPTLVLNLVPLEISMGTPDRIVVSLATGVEPLHSNGQWDAKAGKITWTASAADREKPGLFLPPTCYATWAEPNAQSQTKLLGGVVLTGKDLAAYCLWRTSLTRDQGAQWDHAVSGLKGPGDLGKLQAFRFAGEPPEPPAEVIAKKEAGSDWEYYRRGATLIAEAVSPKAPASQSRPASAPAR